MSVVVSETRNTVEVNPATKSVTVSVPETSVIVTAPGPAGAAGQAATIALGTHSGLSEGATPTVTNTGTSNAAVFNFGIPAGATGSQGNPGADGSDGSAATIAVGSVTTLSAGASATVANAGSSSSATFNFGIPQGVQGVQGEQGVQGDTGATGAAGVVQSVAISGSDGIEIDSGSPITTASGTIALGVNKSTLLSHLNIADGAEVNVQSDWSASSGDAQILNKPTIPSGNQIIDWTASGAGTIHASNYTDTNTTYSVGDGGLTQNNFTNALKTKLDNAATSDEATALALALG